MEFEFYYYALFLATGIIAGFIDAIAGGGGIITIPVLLASGIPPHIALATNKLQGTFGSGMASWNFIRKGFIHWDDVKLGVFYTFIGAALGTYAVLLIDASLPYISTIAACVSNHFFSSYCFPLQSVLNSPLPSRMLFHA